MKNLDNTAKGLKIKGLITDLVNEIDDILDIDEKIDILNYVRNLLHKVSPLNHHPVDFVEWVKSDNVELNDYNPNHVAPPEMQLLKRSIIEDGFTMSIVTTNDVDENTNKAIKRIVDGFHRRECAKNSKEIHESTFGRIPVTTIRPSQKDISNRMASTIRHNRARGSHDIDLMVNIVSELTKAGMSDAWILKHIGMDADELLRLKQISGLAELFKNNEFSNA